MAGVTLGAFVRRMRDTSSLGWLRDIEPYWEEWNELGDEDDPDRESGNPLPGEASRPPGSHRSPR
jgi:hypothetical protein